jgi:hypothetical protein
MKEEIVEKLWSALEKSDLDKSYIQTHKPALIKALLMGFKIGVGEVKKLLGYDERIKSYTKYYIYISRPFEKKIRELEE